MHSFLSIEKIYKHLLSIFLIITFKISEAQVPVITSDPANVEVCAGDSAKIQLTASNFTNFYWQYSLDGTTWITIPNSGNGGFNPPYQSYYAGQYILLWIGANSGFVNTTYLYRCIATNSSGSSTPSGAASLKVDLQTTLAGTAGGTTVCYNNLVIPSGSLYVDHSTCSLIDSITPSGAQPVESYIHINSCVTIDASVQTYNGTPYVQRHYNIVPAFYNSATTATITLYFMQQDFDNYNSARGTLPALPTGPTDADGISNVRVTQYHGAGTLPGTYVGTAGEINPDDNNIVWNATFSRWEITFDIIGFSGFFISTGSLIPLPLTLLDFEGTADADYNLLKWSTTSEKNVSRFEIERSSDGSHFTIIGKLNAINDYSLTNNYSFQDALSGESKQLYYYRLNIIDIDDKSSYSKIVAIQPHAKNLSLEISPNPFRQQITLKVQSPFAVNATIIMTDANGKLIIHQTTFLNKGENTLQLNNINKLQKGIYFLNFITSNDKQIIKLIKQE